MLYNILVKKNILMLIDRTIKKIAQFFENVNRLLDKKTSLVLSWYALRLDGIIYYILKIKVTIFITSLPKYFYLTPLDFV